MREYLVRVSAAEWIAALAAPPGCTRKAAFLGMLERHGVTPEHGDFVRIEVVIPPPSPPPSPWERVGKWLFGVWL